MSLFFVLCSGMKVLFCPLNWGLGHATRMVPLIRQYIEEGYEVILASDGYPLAFLQQEFPELRTFVFPSYRIKYSAGNSQIPAMIINLPYIVTGVIREHYKLQKILRHEHFDIVISDNRFGLWSKHTRCIYITHQVMIKMPRGLKFLENPARLIHRSFMLRYNECLIPDFEGTPNLSGDLSHQYPLPHNTRFIGPLSRFSNMKNIIPDRTFKTVAIVSGIEPQRTIFERFLIEKYKNQNTKTLLLQGKPQESIKEVQTGNLTIVSHLTDERLAEIFTGAQTIICRSGYSGIMDLHALNCIDKTIFVPTPGQTEQEYLALYLHKSKAAQE